MLLPSAQPAHRVVGDRLRRAIAEGMWRSGDRLPGERELAENLATSRVTLRRVLAELQADGVIRCRPRERAEVLARSAPLAELDHLCIATPIPFSAVIDRGSDELSNIVAAAAIGAEAAGLRITSCFVHDRDVASAEGIRGLLRPYYGGLLLIGSAPLAPSARLALEGADCPVVCVSSPGAAGSDRLHSVERDDAAGIRAAVAHLREHGHRRIVHLSYRDDHPWIAQRIAACGPDVAIVRPLRMADRPERSSAIAAVAAALPADATAVLCANDGLADLVFSAAALRGKRIPEDLSVIGFDNVTLAETLGLTTVSHMSGELGRRGITLLLDARKPAAVRRAVHQVVEPTLVVRRSVAPPRG